MLNILRSEWTKLTTTKSSWWTTGLFLVLTCGWAFIQAHFTEDNELGRMFFNPDNAVIVLRMLGLPILAIQSIMMVTTEYRYRLQSQTYLANPRRWQVALMKLALGAALAAALTFIGIVLAYGIMKVFGPEGLTSEFHPFDDAHGKRYLWIYPLAAVLIALFAQGLSLLLRQTAGAVALTLIFYLGIDSFATAIPKIGDKIVNFLPFTAFNNWIGEQVPESAPWDSVAANGWVFVAWAAVLWILGLVMLQSRDA